MVVICNTVRMQCNGHKGRVLEELCELEYEGVCEKIIEGEFKWGVNINADENTF